MGLSISGTTTISAGVYVMAGGGFSASTGNTGVTNTGVGGVTIYNTKTTTLRSARAMAQLARLVLAMETPPRTSLHQQVAPTRDVLFFQDRAKTTSVDLQGGNSGNYSWTGLIYAPSAAGSLQGHTNETITGSLVLAGSLSLSGGSNITMGVPSTPLIPGGWCVHTVSLARLLMAEAAASRDTEHTTCLYCGAELGEVPSPVRGLCPACAAKVLPNPAAQREARSLSAPAKPAVTPVEAPEPKRSLRAPRLNDALADLIDAPDSHAPGMVNELLAADKRVTAWMSLVPFVGPVARGSGARLIPSGRSASSLGFRSR